ncbi:MAG: phage scaffolding protein [Coriobacteriia bacterium]
MKFKKDDEGKLVLDDKGDPIAIDEQGEVIPLDKVVSLGKHTRVETERDDYRGQVEKLNGQIADLQKSSGNAEELQKKLDELTEAATKEKADFEGRMGAKDREYALDMSLASLGLTDEAKRKAAKALIDAEKLGVEGGKLTGFDSESFKKDNAWLFETTESAASAAASRGAGGGLTIEEAEKLTMDEYAKARADGKI